MTEERKRPQTGGTDPRQDAPEISGKPTETHISDDPPSPGPGSRGEGSLISGTSPGATSGRDSKRLGPRMVPLDDLTAHPLNSNVMPPDFRDKLRAHIRRTGRYPFLVVRLHPDEPGKYQVLDGHHRVAVLRDLGHTEARCDVWDVDDREAKLLLATLNRLEGQDAPLRRAQLIHELLGEMNLGDLAGLLPETDKQLEELHSLLEFPAEEIAAMLEAEAEEAERVLPRVMSFVVSPEQEELIEQAVEAASDGTPGRDRRARGLANLAKSYMEDRDDAA